MSALAIVGCGDKKVDSAQVEDGIKQQVVVPGTAVSTVNCPDDIKSEKGATFSCDVKLDNGATGKVKVTQSSPGHFAYAPVPGSVQVPGATLEKSLTQDLAQKGVANASVNCPENIIVKVGTYAVCDVTSASGAKSSVKFTFSDTSGTVDSSSVSSS